MIIYLQNNVLH